MSELAMLRFDEGVCAGHFPGRAIVPGFVLLAAAWTRYAGDHSDEGPVAIGVRHARFRHTVAPGETLSVAARPEGERVRIDLRRESASVADAVFVTGTLPHARVDDYASSGPSRGRELAAAELDSMLPHRPPMRMIDSIDGDDEEGIVCTASIPFACGVVSDGNATVLAAVEAAAQAAAVWASLRAGPDDRGGSARMGYLVGVRDLAWTAPTIAAGERFKVSARLTAIAEPLTHYAIEARLQEGLLLQGNIATVLAG